VPSIERGPPVLKLVKFVETKVSLKVVSFAKLIQLGRATKCENRRGRGRNAH
jgi:hypothetical protein